MFKVEEYSMELLKDPFGILTGERYEFLLDLVIDEEDELYQEEGVCLRVIYLVDRENEDQSKVVRYELLTQTTNRYLDFELEEDELAWAAAYCRECLAEDTQG